MATRLQFLLVSLAFAALIFSFDVRLPLDVAVGVSYVAMVMFSAWSPKRSDVLLVAVLGTVLAIVGAVLSPPGIIPLSYAVANRGLSILAIWVTAYIVYRQRRTQDELAALNRDLELRVAHRSADAHQRAAELTQLNQQLQHEVAQRQQAETEVRNSQAMYASLVEDLPIPVIRKDAQGRFVFANREFCSWMGRPRAEIVGRTDFDLFPAALARKYHEDDQAVLDSGALFLDVERNQHGAKVNWVHVIKTPARDGDHRIIGTQAIFWDVTARREAEDKLRDSEALYHSLVDSLPVCLLRKDRAGTITFVNPALCDFFGMKAEQFVGKTDFDFFPRELAERYREGDHQVLDTGQTYQDVEAIKLPDASQRQIDVIKTPVYDAERNIVGVQIIFQDVTEELQLEAALKKSEQRLQAVLDNTSAVIYIKDLAGRYLLVNREYETLFGIANKELIGRTDFDIFPREFAEKFREVDTRVAATGQIVDLEETAPHPDGPHTYISSKFPLRDERGQIYGIGGISTDITDGKRAEEQLQLYAARLEASNRELEEFAYIVSHDLQEPLRTLAFFSDSLQADLGEKLADQPRRDLQFIVSAADRMQQLVRDLLALSRAGRAELKRQRVALSECVQTALTALSTRIRESGAQIEVGELPEVSGDRTLLTQLFQNLIGNARKFVPKGRAPQVSVSARRQNSSWIVGVHDNGIGIKPEYAQKIFAPFQRLHAQSEYEGTGIGLAICRKVVQRHGGTIWVDSAPGAGAHFQFEIPAEQIADGEV